MVMFNNVSYNTYTTSGLANYSSTTTIPYYGNIQYIHPIAVDSGDSVQGKYNCINIANWFLEKEPMSLDKLQKLCYYAFAWCWAKNHFQIAKTIFWAMSDGPISKDISAFFKEKQYDLLEPMPDYLTCFDNVSLELLESVWETYGEYTGNALCALSETEAPWKAAFLADPSGNRAISVDIMIEYYNSIAQ